jgi:starch phosphorylase
LFYANRPVFIEVMRHAIALNGSSFNTQRIVGQYAARAYLGEGRTRVVLQRR